MLELNVLLTITFKIKNLKVLKIYYNFISIITKILEMLTICKGV